MCSSHQNGVGEREGDSPPTSVDEVMEDAVSPPHRVSQEEVDLELGDFGSTLADRQHGPNHTAPSEDRTGSSTLPFVEEIKKKQTKKRGRWSVGSGGSRGAGGGKTGRSGERGGITLADLAHPVPSSSDDGFLMSSFTQETNVERIRGSSESSLSSCKFIYTLSPMASICKRYTTSSVVEAQPEAQTERLGQPSDTM